MPWMKKSSERNRKVNYWQMLVMVPCFLVSRMELVAEVSGAAVGRVGVEDARGVHDEGRPAEKLVHANACQSCISHLALQARWNKRVILVYSLYSRMV